MSRTITIPFYDREREFIVDFIGLILFDNLLNKFENAIPNKNDVIKVRLTQDELEDLINNLSAEGNHAKKPDEQEMAYELAERLETYESRFSDDKSGYKLVVE